MSITCRDLLRLAQRLAGSHLEVDLRAAGSRAYFAAFHACHQLSQALGLLAPHVQEQEGHHRRLVRAMQAAVMAGGDQADYPVRRLGQALRSLRDQRNVAEYRLGKSFVRSQAKQMVLLSTHILDEVERILWERREWEAPPPAATDDSPRRPEGDVAGEGAGMAASRQTEEAVVGDVVEVIVVPVATLEMTESAPISVPPADVESQPVDRQEVEVTAGLPPTPDPPPEVLPVTGSGACKVRRHVEHGQTATRKGDED
ncbi:MAG: hypothetical protein HQL66_11045 [Magnetococcales bacterium]|nr:hypothetical protein [Magnetococcales bacterium]